MLVGLSRLPMEENRHGKEIRRRWARGRVHKRLFELEFLEEFPE